MNDYLLIDSVGGVTVSLLESTKSGKCRFGGIFQIAEQVNKNKRRYPKPILESNVDRLQDIIKMGGLLGHLDHPQTSQVLLAECALKIVDLHWDGNTLYGEAETLPSPNGVILKNYLDAGIPIGVSSRSIGSGVTDNEGVLVIGESLKVITWDAVVDPSVEQAYQKVLHNNAYESVVSQIPQLKNENKTINKLNVNTLISYLGHLVDTKSQLLRENIKND